MTFRRFICFCAMLTASVFSGCKYFRSDRQVNLTMKLQLDQFIRAMANDPDDELLNKAIKDAVSLAAKNDSPLVLLFGRIFQQENPGYGMATLFVRPSQTELGFNSTNDAVITTLQRQANDAIVRTYRNLQARITTIDRRGRVTLDAKAGMLTAEFKTGYNAERIKSFIESNGDVQFFEIYTNQEFVSYWGTINDTLAMMRSGPSVFQKADAEPGPAEDTGKGDTASLEQYRHRQSGSDPAYSSARNPLFTIVAPAIDPKNSQVMPGPCVGYIVEKDVADLQDILARPRIRKLLPADVLIVTSVPDSAKTKPQPVFIYAVKVPAGGEPILDGRSIASARADYNPVTNQPDVNIEMSPAGARRWAQMTQRNIGSYIAVVIDGHVYSCPRVGGVIESGATEISGSFTPEQAIDLAHLLSSGRLPVPVKIVAGNMGGQL